MSAPIYNPVVPLNLGLNVNPGYMVFITGTPTGGRFSINFKSGPDDFALHFNPRFDAGNIVVRNTKRSGRWEAEERASNGFPFVMGQQFEIIFLIQQHQYKIAVNGSHFVEYKHRVNLRNVRFLTVEGSVRLSMVRFDQEVQHAPPVVAIPTMINHPTIPYVATVPFKNMKGRRMTITGCPENRHPYETKINFKSQSGPNSDIFFHFNPRMAERVIVRTAMKNNVWDRPEERALSTPFPFQYGVPFQLVFHVNQQDFRVELNGMVICTFAHRQRPLNLIRHISVAGSMSVSKIHFE